MNFCIERRRGDKRNFHHGTIVWRSIIVHRHSSTSTSMVKWILDAHVITKASHVDQNENFNLFQSMHRCNK